MAEILSVNRSFTWTQSASILGKCLMPKLGIDEAERFPAHDPIPISMKISALVLSASFLLGGVAPVVAQVSIDTLPETSYVPLAFGRPVAQTFVVPAGYRVDSVTWRFFNLSGLATTSSAAASTLNVYFAEWNVSTDKPFNRAIVAMAGTTSNVGSSYQVPSIAAGSHYDFVFSTLPIPAAGPESAEKTYVAILSPRVNTFDSTIQVGLNSTTDEYPTGEAFRRETSSGAGQSTLAAMAAGAAPAFTARDFDWAFADITISLTPVPETGTVAVAFAGVLVAGLAARRRFQAKRAA